MASPARTILFDFDGTLADTEQAMLESLNENARRFGFPPVETGEHESLRGLEAREFLVKRLGIQPWHIIKALRLVRAARTSFEKRAHQVRLFPEAPELLHSLRSRGFRIGIVSTNAVPTIRAILKDSNPDIEFILRGSVVLGKNRALEAAVRRLGVPSRLALYVGDEIRDARACRALGIPMIGVGWGLNSADALRKEGVEVALTWEELRGKIIARYG